MLLAATRLKALYRYDIDHWFFVDITTVYRDGLHDVAVCHLTFEPDAPGDYVFSTKLAIHSGPISVGQDVAAIGYAGMERTRSWVDAEGCRAWSNHEQQLTFRHGTCVEYFETRGPRGPQGPCFDINVPTEHGMSGGPVILKRYGDEIVAGGIISRGTCFGGDDMTTAASSGPLMR